MQTTVCEGPRGQPQALRWSVGLVPAGAVLCLYPGVTSVIALLAGAAVGLLGGNTHAKRNQAAAQFLLKASVVGLGAGMNLVTVAHAGLNGIGITFFSIIATLAFGLWLGRKMGVSRDLSLLISGGTAICGGSAIAAISGTLQPKAHETTVALATVFLLNGVALVIFPPIGHLAGLTQHQFAWWAALGIHDTSSVTGAGLAYGPEALSLAIVIKLARALWIVPLVLFIAQFIVRREPSRAATAARTRFPWFIAGFIAMAALFTWLPHASGTAPTVTFLSQRVLVATLFLIGAGFTRQGLRAVGVRPLVLAVTLWMIVAGTSLAVIVRG